MKFRLLLSALAAVAAAFVTVASSMPVGAVDIRPRPTVIVPLPTPSLAPIVVVSMGDSLTEGTDPATRGGTYASYRAEMTRLMNRTGQAHTWVVQGIGGTKCSYWAARMASVLSTYHPNLVLLDCGTNDTPTDDTASAYRTILAAVEAYNASGHNTVLVASLIGVPDMKSPTNSVRPYIEKWMLDTNLAIASVIDPCFPASSCPVVPYANMWKVPANHVEWLAPDGIHLTERSNAAYGQLFYQAAQVRMGWLTFEQMRMAPMCGLSGTFRSTDPRPTGYQVCLYGG